MSDREKLLLIDRLEDLLVQAKIEHSHFYTAHMLEQTIAYLRQPAPKARKYKKKIKQLKEESQWLLEDYDKLRRINKNLVSAENNAAAEIKKLRRLNQSQRLEQKRIYAGLAENLGHKWIAQVAAERACIKRLWRWLSFDDQYNYLRDFPADRDLLENDKKEGTETGYSSTPYHGP